MKDISQSIYQRLLNKSREKKEDFNYTLTRYSIERFLYRLSVSEYKENFILKGASLFIIWNHSEYRVTRDVDFLGFGKSDIESIKEKIKNILEIDCSDKDGISFESDNLKISEIREKSNYNGLRILVNAKIKTAKIKFQIDIGFGDVITPQYESQKYPTMLDLPEPALNTYNQYTFLAEKIEICIKLGILNSRMKDFYDIYIVTNNYNLQSNLLIEALKNTFSRRKTKIPKEYPFIFTKEFYEDKQKNQQWKAFLKKIDEKVYNINFKETILKIEQFLLPIFNDINGKSNSKKIWNSDYYKWENLKNEE